MTATGKNILIVDDTPENITALSAILAPFGKIKAATSGEKALKICAGDPRPDLVFLDILMPEMDGWEVLGRLKADPATAAIPVIYVTALASDEDREKATSLGAAGFITKPLDPEAIRRLVTSMI
ncbi:MAG: response regulator [Spirochaetes bacterium]|nr:response regulator [Spirochaetota bacterium]